MSDFSRILGLQIWKAIEEFYAAGPRLLSTSKMGAPLIEFEDYGDVRLARYSDKSAPLFQKTFFLLYGCSV